MRAACASNAGDLRTLCNQLVMLLCVRPGQSRLRPGFGRGLSGTPVSRRLGCPVTAKIARPATLTCHEESLLSICGYRDIRLARFWQRLDPALVNEDCSSGALVVRGVFSAELDAGCALGWRVTGSDIAHGQGEDPLLAVVSLSGSEPRGPWGVEVPSGFFGEREEVSVVRRLDQEADPVWGGL